MSLFWKYFHDRLNWPAIFRPGPVSALVRGLSLHMDDVREDVLWLRRQWNPATADDDRIAAYGASRGIRRTRYDTDESYRLRVVNAYAWHKLGGKVRGLVQILAENGFDGAVIVSVNDVRRYDASLAHNGAATYNDGLCWAQFDVNLVEIPETGLDADVLAWFRWLVNEYKPARSILRALSWKTTIADETALAGDATASDETSLTAVLPCEDVRLWGYPLYDGSISHDNGIFRACDGRLIHDGSARYTRWEPAGHLYNAQLDPLAVNAGPVMADAVRYVPRYDGALTHDGQGIYGEMSDPAVDALNTGLRAVCRDSVNMTDGGSPQTLGVAIRDEAGRYHDGSITYGQRYVSLYSGALFYDGSRQWNPYGGRADFSGLRYDGRARHDGTALHSLWGWLDTAGELAPVFTYATLSDVCAASLRMAGMEDDLTLSDAASLRVLRYTLHDGAALYDGNARCGGEEIAA